MMILISEICVNFVTWIDIAFINRTSFLMTFNIAISMNLVNLTQTVLFNRTFFTKK